MNWISDSQDKPSPFFCLTIKTRFSHNLFVKVEGEVRPSTHLHQKNRIFVKKSEVVHEVDRYSNPVDDYSFRPQIWAFTLLKHIF